MNRRLVIAGVVLAVAVSSLALALNARGTSPEVELEIVEKRALRATVLGSGTFDFQDTAALSPEVIGRVREVMVNEGDAVQQGQLVMVLDQETQKAEVDQRESMVRQKEVDIQRQAAMLKLRQQQARRSAELVAERLVDVASDEQVQHEAELARLQLAASREELRQSRAALAQVREILSKTHIRAPISGVVTAIALKVGETAVPSSTGIAGSSLMTIADVSTMTAKIKVDEMDVARLQAGQSAMVFAGSAADKSITGRVHRIALAPPRNGMDTSSTERSYEVEIALQDGDHATLRTGMSCRAEIFVDQGRESVAVPVQAVMTETLDEVDPSSRKESRTHRRQYVLVELGGAVLRRYVQSGMSDDTYVEIVSGISPGDRVVVGPAKVMRHLRDNQSVNAVLAGPGGP
ncbi:efflux RND transporter periplasmic adaptor subunit [Stenotrophomonas rhizophila]|uniref:efflux RND transporter periplasmic adaptor subunit n=1 Tax=Stenotrophomonas rhizophila TaxID=216778 RepID=UPI0028B22881|nr:efflux RND transporter periplasmic adaptor subunit [Stenotrophomonas rhizophila]